MLIYCQQRSHPARHEHHFDQNDDDDDADADDDDDDDDDDDRHHDHGNLVQIYYQVASNIFFFSSLLREMIQFD